jgi:hypothetical protein
VTVAAVGARLRVLAHVDRMGPQYAAYWGLMAQGSLPRVGDSQVLVEVSPSNAVFPLTDVAMKRTSVRSAGTLIERDFGLMELHADTSDAVLEAADAVLEALDMGWADRMAPTVVSTQLLSNITPDHSQLFNKVRRGAWTLPGDTLYVLEVTPAAWVYLIANEVEKGVDIELVRAAGTGLYGRLIVAGQESAAQMAEQIALGLIDSVRHNAVVAAEPAGGR